MFFRSLFSLAGVKSKFTRQKGLEEFFENASFLSRKNVGLEPSISRNYGRSWSAPELRRKDFSDLHRLWYILLKEKNLLLTQQAEAKRLGVRWIETDRLDSVCQSMARVKTVLTERRVAYERAREEDFCATASKEDADRLAYIREMMAIKGKRHGFRRLLRFILRKNPNFD